MAEISRKWSPYNYAENNPIRNIDPDGMAVIFGQGEYGGDLYTGVDAQNLFKSIQQQKTDKDKKKDKEKNNTKNKKDSEQNKISGWQMLNNFLFGNPSLAMDVNIGGDYGSLLIGGELPEGIKSLEKLDHFVYYSIGSEGVDYVGITNNIARREAEQLTAKGINIIPLMENLTKADARAVEQALIEIHGLPTNGGTLLNKINSIAKSNPKYATAIERGYELLKSIGYKY